LSQVLRAKTYETGVKNSALSDLARLLDAGKPRAAVTFGRKLVRAHPDDSEMRLGLAQAYLALGQRARAKSQVEIALQQAPDRPEGYFAQGELYMQSSAFEQAARAFAAGLRCAGAQSGAHLAAGKNGAGRALLALGYAQPAAPQLAAALQAAPRNPAYARDLAAAFCALGETAQADACFDIAAAAAPVATDAGKGAWGARELAAARALLKAGDAERAARRYAALAEMSAAPPPLKAQAYNGLGAARRAQGARDAAAEALKQACQLAPTTASYLYNLSTVQTAQKAGAHSTGAAPCDRDGLIGAARRLAAQARGGKDAAMALFAQAKWLDDIGAYAAAFEAFEAANAASTDPACGPVRPKPVDLAAWQARRDGAAMAGDSAVARGQAPTPTAVFVTGLPRSGTTLLADRLARHIAAAPLGETDALEQALRRNAATGAPVAQSYRAAMPRHLHSARAWIDKMPRNAQFIGPILTDFQNARVLHIRRDLRAVGWSLFRHYFTSGGPAMAFARAQDSILQAVADHVQMMRDWDAVFGERIHHVSYEAFVAAPQAQLQALEAALAVPQSPDDVMDARGIRRVPQVRAAGAARDAGDSQTQHGQGAPAIQTASALQVRGQIYQGSSDAWRAYEPFAPDWFAALHALEP